MAHDFKAFPELTNNQLDIYYFQSPHKQITEDFTCTITKVHDGDTVTASWDQRDFTFPIRMLDLFAPELDEPNGIRAQKALERVLLNQEVLVEIDRNNRVEKFGRLLGRIIHQGINMNEWMVDQGLGETFAPEKAI